MKPLNVSFTVEITTKELGFSRDIDLKYEGGKPHRIGTHYAHDRRRNRISSRASIRPPA